MIGSKMAQSGNPSMTPAASYALPYSSRDATYLVRARPLAAPRPAQRAGQVSACVMIWSTWAHFSRTAIARRSSSRSSSRTWRASERRCARATAHLPARALKHSAWTANASTSSTMLGSSRSRISTSTRTSLVYRRLSLLGRERHPDRTFSARKRRLRSARLMTCSSTSQRRLPPGCDTTVSNKATRCWPPCAWKRRATSTRSSARSGNPTKRPSNRGTKLGVSTSGPSSANTSSALHAATPSVCSCSAMPTITETAWFASSPPTM
mmetsp:Transcript_96970/g.269822  ORF Transcript_96970/g.269822 Transcript_96970/m.269822 type:complete len:266 (-) Transcript_96970:399-1196(-)